VRYEFTQEDNVLASNQEKTQAFLCPLQLVIVSLNGVLQQQVALHEINKFGFAGIKCTELIVGSKDSVQFSPVSKDN